MKTDFIAVSAMCVVVGAFVFACMSRKSGADAGVVAVCLVLWMAFLAFTLIPFREKYGKHLPSQPMIARMR